MEYKRLSVDSRIIEHLGTDLITSSDVAVIELIKNSLDAGSKKINIHLFDNLNKAHDGTQFLLPIPRDVIDQVPQSCLSRPLLVVEDIGSGMNEKVLDTGFLRIGTDIKKNKEKSSDMILGEKGIGRLATQRLGRYLIVETASSLENHASMVVIDWDTIFKCSNISETNIPYYKFPKLCDHYTRLWILDVNPLDIIQDIGNNGLFLNSKLELNHDLRSAVCFLISPFEHVNSTPTINFYYNNDEIDYKFEHDYLQFAESCHEFKLTYENCTPCLTLSLDLLPWFIEKTHRTCIKPTSHFSKYKKSFDEYNRLLKKYQNRYDITLKLKVSNEDLYKTFRTFKKKLVSNKKVIDTEAFNDYLNSQIEKEFEKLSQISPIHGKVYSFKRDSAIGNMYVEFAQYNDSNQSGNGHLKKYTIANLQDFLEQFNGVKLYRQQYRIGFLGNKDNDWIQLQQYRTLGQQFYRFNLGNTIGYVSLNDPTQKYIREISSRLDMYQNTMATYFKEFINIVFNTYFYDLTKSADYITKEILKDEGWIPTDVDDKIQKNDEENKRLLKQNKALIQEIKKTRSLLSKTVSLDGQMVGLSTISYKAALETLDKSNIQMLQTQEVFKSTQDALEEAKSGLKQIEVEAFNNYKLMANGLITETITHELHSLVKHDYAIDIDQHFVSLQSYLMNESIKIYREHFLPIRDQNEVLVERIEDVADLYEFLEKTFIKQNSFDEFEVECIADTVKSIQNKLIKDLNKQKIEIICKNLTQSWLMPKGVLLHVLYNLFSNSMYWIDIRRKRSLIDTAFLTKTRDSITVEQKAHDNIIVYDTGTGVSNRMEYVLFDALKSGKENEQGRGMGLYIVKHLLNSFKGNIELLDDRNSYGNRYIFSISVPEDCIK